MRKEELIKGSGPDVSHDVALNSGVKSAPAVSKKKKEKKIIYSIHVRFWNE